MTKLHATWSASATARNWHCAGALALSADAKPQPESIHAARGTACHDIAERALRAGTPPSIYLGETVRTQEHEIVIDDELVRSATVYTDYVRERWGEQICSICHQPQLSSNGFKCINGHEDAPYYTNGLELDIEQRFDLASLGTPFDAGGTADAVLIDADGGTLEVVDLKNGMGVVDVRENPQLRTYAVGALLANPGLPVETVTVTIVQPRVAHRDGPIRSETIAVADLLEWTGDLLAAMHRSKVAADHYEKARRNTVSLDEWAKLWLRPGKCVFCPAMATCPAIRRQASDLAGMWFEDGAAARPTNTPDTLSAEALAQTLGALDNLEAWIGAVRAYAKHQAESGVEVPGYQLAETHGHRKWSSVDDLIVARLHDLGLTEDQIFDRKLRTPAALEKALGKGGADRIAGMWVKPVTGRSLVRVDKATLPPAQSVAERYFQATEN